MLRDTSSSCAACAPYGNMQGDKLQHSEVDRVKAQVWELERRIREAAASEAAARRECQRLIDAGPVGRSEMDALARDRDAEVARRKKAEAEVDRLTQSLRLNSGLLSDSTGTRSPVTFDASEAEMIQVELLMKEVDKVWIWLSNICM
jgi:uncharacterized membrane protein